MTDTFPRNELGPSLETVDSPDDVPTPPLTLLPRRAVNEPYQSEDDV